MRGNSARNRPLLVLLLALAFLTSITVTPVFLWWRGQSVELTRSPEPKLETEVAAAIRVEPEYAGIEQQQGRIEDMRCEKKPAPTEMDVAAAWTCYVDFAKVKEQLWSVQRNRQGSLWVWGCVNKICN